MMRVLMCYPTSFTTNEAWIGWVQKAWEKEHPTQVSEVFPAWELSMDLEWEEYTSHCGAVVLIEAMHDGKLYLDDRAAQVGRDALVAGKEVWLYRRSAVPNKGIDQAFLRVADIRHDADERARALVRSPRGKKRRKQP